MVMPDKKIKGMLKNRMDIDGSMIKVPQINA